VTNIIHGNNLRKRYQIIADEIGEDKKVFEPGCGTAMVHSFLHQGCTYEGWDLNSRFLAYCGKRGLRVFNKDIFDFAHYPECDVILLCDVLHHVIPEHERLVAGAMEKAKKVIVSEPARSIKPPRLFAPLLAGFAYLFGDYDGINSHFNQLKWDYDEAKLRHFFQCLGSRKTVKIGWDMIAVFEA